MLDRLRRYIGRHHVALLALFVAMGGTAYAAATVNSGDVVDNSLKSVDLKNNAAVKSADVVDRTLRAKDLTVISGTSTQDLGSINQGTCTDFDPGETGVQSSDLVLVSVPREDSSQSNLVVDAYPAFGKIVIVVCNVGTSAADPPSLTFRYAVIR